jgi:hypothetical protein
MLSNGEHTLKVDSAVVVNHMQVNLRAIPVRCPALDSVVNAFAHAGLNKAELAAFLAREDEGRSAANKLNKVSGDEGLTATWTRHGAHGK